MRERTPSKLIATIACNQIIGPALEVKFVYIPSDDGRELVPGVAIMIESKIREMRPTFAQAAMQRHVWVNILKGTTQFANYIANPILTANKIEKMTADESSSSTDNATVTRTLQTELPPLLDV